MKKLYILCILLLGIALRVVHLNQSLWLDEAAQAIESARPLSQQLNIVADFHPPLYHLFLHFWMILGTSEVWLRLPSVFAGVGCIVVLVGISRQLGYAKAAYLGGLLLAISPLAIWYSQEARPYMVFTFFALLSTYAFLKKKWIFYIIFSIIALYLNYFAPFVFISQLIYAVIVNKNSLKKLIISLMVVGVSFVPWLPSLIDQLRVGTAGVFKGWTDVVSISSPKVIPLTFAKFIFGKGTIDDNLMYTLILLPVLIIFFYSVIILGKERKHWGLVSLFFFPLLIVTLLTNIVPVAAPQRLLFILPYFILILSAGIETLPKKEKYFCVLLIMATSLGGLWQYYTNPKVQREQWRQAIEYINKKSISKSVALFAFPEPFAPFQWYSSKKSIKGVGVAPKFIYSRNDEEIIERESKNKQTVYIFQYLTGLTDPKDLIGKKVVSLNFNQKDTLNFEGVGFIYVYDKD